LRIARRESDEACPGPGDSLHQRSRLDNLGARNAQRVRVAVLAQDAALVMGALAKAARHLADDGRRAI
jgi:hypothetical protein